MKDRSSGTPSMAFARGTLPWGLLCAAVQLHAVPVNEVAPANLPGVLRADGAIVVHFTSSDAECGYCRGQDSEFDAFAASQTGEAKFARVQWAPWRPLPTLEMPEPLYGIPHESLFRSGRVVAEHSGMSVALAKLRRLIADALDGKLAPRFDPAASKPPDADKAPVASLAASPPADADWQVAVRLARRDWVREAVQRCADPADAETYRLALDDWQNRYQTELNQANLLIVTRSSRSDAANMSAVTEAQVRRLQDEAPMSSPTAQDCGRLTSALAD